MQVNIIVLEILLLAAGVTAILLKEFSARANVNILPDIRSDLKIVAPQEYQLPTDKNLDEIISKAKIKQEKEVTVEIVEEAPKVKLKDALKSREEKPQEITIDIE